MAKRTPFSFLLFGSTRQRLWLGGLCLLLFICTIIAGNRLAAPDRAISTDLVGRDFIAFYTAGTFARQGQFDALYDLGAIRAFQNTLAAQHGLKLEGAIGPWWNPPFYAWVFAPLSRLSYPSALAIWIGFNALCAAAAISLLMWTLVAGVMRTWRLGGDSDDAFNPAPIPRPDTSWRVWGLVPLLFVVSMPFIQVIIHGQNGGMSLLLLTLIVLAWRADQSLLAGLLCGLLFYKPQLAAVVAGVLVLSMGIRAGLGLLCSGIGLIVLTISTMPASLGDFFTIMPANLQQAQQTLPYLWQRHVTLLAFWRLLIQGQIVGPTASLATLLALQGALVIGGGLVVVALHSRKRVNRLENTSRLIQRLLRQMQLDRLISATILCMPLIMPFYFDYDLVLLVIPAVLVARQGLIDSACFSHRSGARKFNLWLWTALFLCLMINAPLGEVLHLNLAVPLMALMAMISLWRAWPPVSLQQTAVPAIQVTPVVARRAA
ncbi:MAG: DUF2029 domain-containing protein [Phycisphaerales bacterium]|nr:DUF2029 domain-containing protein [Phycisphaerales bacterium]